ncbi:MAG: OmpA family protein [Spirochaetia bacterium]|nr:OmpA family protein [Spirochaetia bacterium]
MARKKKKVEEKGGSGESGSGRWMLTYLDMVTLLFGVFVLLYALKEDNPIKVRMVEESIRQAFLGQGIGHTGLLEGGLTSFRVKNREGRAFLDAYKKATELFKPEIKSKQVRIEDQERGVIISFVGENYFAPGSAHVSDSAKMTLAKVAKLIRGLNSFIRVEGYSDEMQVMADLDHEKKYDTDWELAGARAINVLRYLSEVEDVEPGKMSATTYGKFRKVSRSYSPEGRSLNRRVDIIILKRADYKREYKDEDLPQNKLPDIEMETGP